MDKSPKRSFDRNSLDHLGKGSFGAAFYPSSIWVDSLMMWGLLSWRVGLGSREGSALLAHGLAKGARLGAFLLLAAELAADEFEVTLIL